MRLKNLQSSALFALLSVFALTAAGGSQEYTGTVIPFDVLTYTAGTNLAFYGALDYVARKGQILRPFVRDSKGKIVEKGDYVLRLNSRYWQAMVDQSAAATVNARQQLNVTRIDYLRYKKLASENAVSVELYQQMETNYQNALNNYWIDWATQIMNEDILEACNDEPPFECIVTGVYMTNGPLAGWPNTVEITQLRPIWVKVKMDRDKARMIDSTTPVKIIPPNSEPQGIYYGYSMLADDGIMFATDNFPVINGYNIITDDKTRITRDCGVVRRFYIDRHSDELAVPAKALVKEGGKCYVWRAKGQKMMQADKGMDNIFEIEKVYVEPSGMYRSVDNFETVVKLKDPGKLELYDVVLTDPDSTLKDNQKIMYPESRYLLMPGDQVKVVIGN